MAEGGFGCTDSETDRVHRHSSLYSRHSRNYVESVSVEISTIMTRLGYGEEMRKWRVKKYKDLDKLSIGRQKEETIITAGSKAEGLTSYLESDHDMLHLQNFILCVETGISLHTIPEDMDVFRMDTRVYPGHCILLLERLVHFTMKIITAPLCDNGYGEFLFSSSLFLDECSASLSFDRRLHVVQHKRAGPSTPHTINEKQHTDTVHALRCLCPSVLQRWAARPRQWPLPVIVQKVVSLGAYVTPTGFKDSVNKHIEWRICFNSGETELINNLNDTQAKVYVILKMILKYILKPKNKEITSYILKNIVLWQAERNPQTRFSAYSLLLWLHDGLRELRTAIAKKYMPYYMIPERNLMEACGITNTLHRKWVADITDMLEEGPRVILRLEKIRKAIVASPEPMLWYSKTRMELEMLLLENRTRFKPRTDDNGDELIEEPTFVENAIILRLIEVWEDMRERMLLEGSSVNDCRDIFDAMLM
ncbi:uncharacterized protein LOC127838386 isoform X2 [Dreissena polymorpha]|uniref:Mab-21-like HhH/H2TH-like domain-containing protein n=2 Tax=Dreissena polymorpha TaxID=45954 RepID=A0A9D4F691_DREPO|nr:uncharacterized protein LOC127838386 isoform X2 [Dreissena polymorpha]KAH3792728.1 hypothetical protein DPMN_146227 [Dreissena polymorpha]